MQTVWSFLPSYHRFEGAFRVSHICASLVHLARLERGATTMRASVFIRALQGAERFVVLFLSKKIVNSLSHDVRFISRRVFCASSNLGSTSESLETMRRISLEFLVYCSPSTWGTMLHPLSLLNWKNNSPISLNKI